MADLSSAYIGLSLLSGSNAFATGESSSATSGTTVETRAVRTAKAAFATEEATPPWRAKTTKASESVELSKVKTMKTIVDKPTGTDRTLDADVQTSFTAYKALDRLRLLAESAAKDTTSSAERTKLQTAFAKGLADLETYLAGAPSDLVDLSFARSARQVQSVGVATSASQASGAITGRAVADERSSAVAGVTGAERLRIDLSTPGYRDSVTVDLAQGAQPPTLDSVAAQINAAIAALPRVDAAGDAVLDADGAPVPRYAVSVAATKIGERWGLSIDREGYETVAIDEIGAGDAILVANGATAGSNAGVAAITRFDDPAATMSRRTLATLTATDSAATERAKLAAEADSTKKTKPGTVAATVSVAAVATDAQGFSYVVGTSAGDLGSNLSDGADDLYLTKLDSEGATVWRRTLGAAGSATGAAVTIAADGGIVVAGSVTGGFDGEKTDGDMLVARYDANGNESFATLVRAVGVDSASAVAVGGDGAIYVGGATASGGGDAVIARFDSQGRLAERRVIGGAATDGVKALAIATDGALLALTGEAGQARLRRIDRTALATDLATLDLGTADARAMAVAADGSIAVAGAVDRADSRDAFVARVDAGLGAAAFTYFASSGDDQADSVAILDGRIYVGGRTTGALAGAKTGTTDAFVARVDGDAVAISQYGTADVRADFVKIAAIAGGDSVLGALGLHRGTLTPTDAVTLPAQTSLRAGDEFAIRVNNGAVRRITIAPGETLTTLSNRVRTLIGNKAATVTTPLTEGGRGLRIEAKPGNELELIAGGSGKDALAKLGIDSRRIATPAPVAATAPTVRPGGSYGLGLSDALRIDTKADAAVALGQVRSAISTTQSAYRSLYWDETKAKLVDSPATSSKAGGSTAVQKSQLANYQAALTRLTDGSTSSYGY